MAEVSFMILLGTTGCIITAFCSAKGGWIAGSEKEEIVSISFEL